MSKILVVGESGEMPWSDGAGSRRLWSWFGVKSYQEMQQIADLMNVMPHKGDKVVDENHLAAVLREAEQHDLVYLIGKRAQVLVMGCYDSRIMWHEGKFVGLPHPSGLNRQINTLDEATIKALVAISIKVKEGRYDVKADMGGH